MAFLLYRIDSGSKVCRFVADLKDHNSLWGQTGAVARLAGQGSAANGSGGPWCITDVQLLSDLVPRVAEQLKMQLNPSECMILDDLLPRGQQTLIAKIVQINGFLAGGPRDYNPILFTFDLLVDELGQLPRQEVPIPPSPPRVRSIGYLLNKWDPPGPFRGALLWEAQWQYFRGL